MPRFDRMCGVLLRFFKPRGAVWSRAAKGLVCLVEMQTFHGRDALHPCCHPASVVVGVSDTKMLIASYRAAEFVVGRDDNELGGL